MEEYSEQYPQEYPDNLYCDNCGQPTLKPENAHYKCSNCGARTSCCEGAPQ